MGKYLLFVEFKQTNKKKLSYSNYHLKRSQYTIDGMQENGIVKRDDYQNDTVTLIELLFEIYEK